VASLGSFGKPKAAAPERSFEFFEATVRVDPGFGELDFADLMAKARTVDTEGPSGMGLLVDIVRNMVHEGDFEQFWKIARRERQTVTDLMEIVYAVVEAVAERPTEQPSDSSAGLQSAGPSSTADSSSQVIRRLEQSGRPDLALMVTQAQEARVAV
jgi:hypothetical protein